MLLKNSITKIQICFYCIKANLLQHRTSVYISSFPLWCVYSGRPAKLYCVDSAHDASFQGRCFWHDDGCFLWHGCYRSSYNSGTWRADRPFDCHYNQRMPFLHGFYTGFGYSLQRKLSYLQTEFLKKQDFTIKYRILIM